MSSLSTAAKTILKQNFSSVTQTSVTVAQYWLSRNNWDLSLATDSFLNKQSPNNGRSKGSIEGQIASVNKASSDKKKLEEIFNKYKDSTTNNIEIDGTIQYLEDLKIDPEDPITLCLAYILKSPSTGQFSHDEFISNWQELNCTTIESMSNYLMNTLNPKLFNKNDFSYLKEVYNFTFNFILENPNQKKISSEDAISYWELLFLPIFKKETKLWIEFINEEWNKPINKDNWEMLFLFFEDFHKDPKLENYDDNASWPYIIDLFVEWVQENEKLKENSDED